MANLVEKSVWVDGIYQLEITDPVQGGPDGIDNWQAKALANRTLYLRDTKADNVDGDPNRVQRADRALVADRAVQLSAADSGADLNDFVPGSADRLIFRRVINAGSNSPGNHNAHILECAHGNVWRQQLAFMLHRDNPQYRHRNGPDRDWTPWRELAFADNQAFSGNLTIASHPIAVVAAATGNGETNLPIGASIYVIVGASPPARNAPLVPRLSGNTLNYTTSGTGAALSGIWRSCGDSGLTTAQNTILARRVA